MTYEVRKTGDGFFYLVTIDDLDNSAELYSEGKLVRFEGSKEAKEYIKELELSGKIPNKKKRRFF